MLKDKIMNFMIIEGVSTKDIEKALREIELESTPFTDIPKDEQIDYFIGRLSASDHEAEIADMLCTCTAYNDKTFEMIANNPAYQKYCEHDSSSLKELLNGGILSADDPFEEQDVWDLIFNVLGINMIFKCFDDDQFRWHYLEKIIRITSCNEKELRKAADEILKEAEIEYGVKE